MAESEDKAYYRINDKDASKDESSVDAEMATGSKRSKKKWIILISIIGVVLLAVLVLLLVLLLRGNSSIESGYNGYGETESLNQDMHTLLNYTVQKM